MSDTRVNEFHKPNLLLVNQKHSAWPVKSNSQTNDSNKVIFREHLMNPSERLLNKQ